MLTYSQIIEIITDTANLTYEGIERDIEKHLSDLLYTPKPVKIITGIRRSGKSFLLKRLYKKLLSQNIPQKNILFLNFEDDRLNPFLSLQDLRNIYELFYSYSDPQKPFYLFLDQIQNIKGWEKFVRTIYDTTNHNIFITGSNSQLLSGEFASVLGGRFIEFQIFPFSFAEVLKFHKIDISDRFAKAKNRIKIRYLADKYLNFGGFPEVQNLDTKSALAYRKSLIEKIVFKDIFSRYKIENPFILTNLTEFLEKNTGNLISFSNLARLIKISDKTVENYLTYFQNAFIGKILPKFSWKTKEIFTRQKKFYFTDNLFTYFADIEDKLENFVYTHLARHFDMNQIYFGRDERGKEIDFLVKTHCGKFLAFQVSVELTDSNFKREISSLLLFDKYINSQNTKFFLIYMQNKLKNQIPPKIELLYFTDLQEVLKKVKC